jgi:hypothetical protein
MGTGVARVLVRYGAAGDPGDSGVDPEKTQANEEEEDDGEDEFLCMCVLRFFRFSLSLSRAFDVVSFHFCSLPGCRYVVSKCRTCCYSFFFASREVFGGDFDAVLRGLLSREAGRGGGESWARGKGRQGKLERER